jgi:hypothetical protein
MLADHRLISIKTGEIELSITIPQNAVKVPESIKGLSVQVDAGCCQISSQPFLIDLFHASTFPAGYRARTAKTLSLVTGI